MLIIKLIFWKDNSLLAYGFYMKHNQDNVIFLMSYNSLPFDDMKFLAYGVSRHYVTSVKMTSSPLQKYLHPF